jgi:hypothetical protein
MFSRVAFSAAPRALAITEPPIRVMSGAAKKNTLTIALSAILRVMCFTQLQLAKRENRR